MPLPSLFSSHKNLSTTPEITTGSPSIFNLKSWLASRADKPSTAVQPAQLGPPEKHYQPKANNPPSSFETAHGKKLDPKVIAERAEEDKKRILYSQANLMGVSGF